MAIQTVETIILLSAIFLSSCNHSGISTSKYNTSDSIESAYSKAFRLYQEERPMDEVTEWQNIAIEEMRSGVIKDDPVGILAQSGQFHIIKGDYIAALDYLQEASDSLIAREKLGIIPRRSNIRVHGNLARLYVRFGLYEEALRENHAAISTSHLLDYADASDVWRIRGLLFQDFMGNKIGYNKVYADSVLYCFGMSKAVIPLMGDNVDTDLYKSKSDFSRADFFITHSDNYKDSLQWAKEFLEKDIAKKRPFSISEKVLLGRVCVLTGNITKGLSLMESGLQEYRDLNNEESVEWTLDLLAQSYADARQGEKLVNIYPEVKAFQDTILNNEKINAVIGADFRYRTLEKQKEAELLKSLYEKSRKVILYESIALVIGLIAGAFLMLSAVKYYRKTKAEKEYQQREIDRILLHQKTLNSTIEELNSLLHLNENEKIIDKVIESLNFNVLKDKDENSFRKAFASLHPHFLNHIRRDYPTLTGNDELLCMLIYLKVPASDISAVLGITRMSLNSARYRIRKKFNLEKETDLDTFIQSL